MLRRLNRLWALSFILVSGQTLALGLGDIRLDSALNEPLRAEIALISATPEELENLTIRIASADAFARYGLDRPAYLSSVNFRVIRSGRRDGNIVRVTSALPITEPFVTFLVEADWAQGRLLREYTVLLDPPTFAPPPAEQITEAVQPPVRSQPADAGDIERPPPRPEPRPTPAPAPVRTPSTAAPAPALEPVPSEPAREPARAADFDTTPGGDYRVQRGDTLWGLAIRFRPDNRLTINQTMLAIFEANPDAFADNINRLSAGASLRIPSADEIFRITRADAFTEVQRQNEAWSGGAGAAASATSVPAPQPSLELVPPDEDSLSAESGTVYDGPEIAETDAGADAGGIDRITEIENLLEDQQDGLVVISSTELAALRRELAELRGEELPADLVADSADAAAADTAVDDEIFVDDSTDEVFAEDEPEAAAADDSDVTGTSTEPEVAEPAPAPRPVTRQPQQSLVDTILGYLTGIWGMIALAVVLAVGVLLFFARRAARKGGEDEDATEIWRSLDDDEFGAEAEPERTAQLPTMERADENFVVEETARSAAAEPPDMTRTMEIPASEVPSAMAPDGNEATGTNVALEETFSSDTALNLDQSDPIAEADFHMAYGLYDQAADLVNGALAVNPDRTDLLAKLCEIYFVWGNRDAFIDAAERFKALLGDDEDPEWDKTVIMGQQIAGDYALFSDSQGMTKAVDLAFGDDGDEAALDMDFGTGPQDSGDVIDLGAEEPAETVARETSGAIDFVFDDDDEAAASADAGAAGEVDPFEAAFGDDGGTAVMPKMDEPTAELPMSESSLDDAAESPATADSFDDDGETGELPALDARDATAEMPAISDDDVTRLASRDGAGDSDATSEINLDDLGLDLDSLDDDLAADADDLSDLDVNTESMSLNDADLPERNEAGEESGDDEAAEPRLHDVTGQTQILSDDFAVGTGTGTSMEKALSEDDADILGDAENLLSSMDDDDEVDVDFAGTEASSRDADELTSELPDSTDLDLDFDDLTAAIELNTTSDTAIQRRDDETDEQPRPGNGENGFDDSHTVAFSPDELSADLHDARTMTEVGTKLDLARAYVDMGDPGGARSILEEVLDEGDAAQRQQAQQLLDSLPA